MLEIEFGNPHLRRVKRVQKYELDGVAFVKGYEKTVGLTFECQSRRNCMLRMEDLYQAKEVYRFFSNLLNDYSEKESDMRKSGPRLYAEWNITEGQVQEVLDRIEKAMGTKWKEAFRTILTVYEK